MPKATNICALEAAEIKYLPSNTVLISINEEYGDLYKLQVDRNSDSVLTVRFSDITCKTHDERIGKTFYPIGDETALKILNFINEHKGKDFIVHCAVGISRSAAICLYLNLFEGYELKASFWSLSNPNKYVLGQLIFSKFKKRVSLDN